MGDAEGTEEEAEAPTTVDTTATTTVTEDTTVDTTATTTVVDAEGTAAAEEEAEVEEGATEAAAAAEEGRRCAATSSVAGASVRTAVSATAKAAEDVAADSADTGFTGVNPVVRRHSSRVTGTARSRSASFTTLQLALHATSVARINLPAPVAKAEGEAAREDVAARRVRVGTTAGVRARVVVTADRRASAGRVAAARLRAARLRKLRQSQPKPRRKGARDSAKERVVRAGERGARDGEW